MRWSRAIAATVFGSGAILLATSSPAAANTNFNANCETSEACVWELDYHEGFLWDFEGTDTNFTNNFYPRGGPNLDNTATAIENKGTLCTAVFGQNVGDQSAQGWTIRVARGTVWDGFRDARNNGASSLWWVC